MLHCLGIVQTKILNIQDGVVVRLEDGHGLLQGWGVGSLKDPFSDPAAEVFFEVFADEMQEPSAGLTDGTIDISANSP